MAITLRDVPAARLPEWIERSTEEYARDLAASGQPADQAERVAREGMAESFPDGAPTPGHSVLDVLDENGAAVGYLWIGPAGGPDPHAWWVWDVLIDERNRGRGLGRATMLLAEEYAASRGAHTLGLSVFGFNSTARRLYESLDYETTTVKMHKPLRPPGPPVR